MMFKTPAPKTKYSVYGSAVLILFVFLNIFILPVSALSGQDKNSSAYFKAENLFFQKEFDKALRAGNAVPKDDPYYLNALVLSGHIYLHMDLPDSAEKKFFSILKFDHQNSLAYNGLGLVYYNKISPAKRIIQRLKSFFIETNEEKSEKMFLRALKYKENYPDALYNLARLYLKSREKARHEKAENILSGLLRKFPGNSLYIFAMGETKFILTKYSEAAVHFSRLVSANPDDSKSRLNLAFCHLKLQEFETFSKNFSEAVRHLIDKDAQARLVKDCWDIFSRIEKEYVRSVELSPDFFYTFWIKKDPNPISEINERLVIHYKRLYSARGRYKSDDFAGYDDRGGIYIRYGEPDVRYEDPMPGINVKGNISWAYNFSDKVLTFDFVESGSGYYLVDDLSEALASGIRGNAELQSLISLYENRTNLSQLYARTAADLSTIPTDDPNETRDNRNFNHIISRHRINKTKEREKMPVSTYPFKLPGKDLPFDFNYAYFFDSTDKVRLEFYFAFNYGSLRLHREGTDSRNITQEILIQNSEHVPLLKSRNAMKIKNINTSSGKYITQTNAFVDQNALFCSIQLEDEENNQRRLLTLPINFQPLQKDSLNMSSIELAGSIRPCKESDPPVFKKNDLTVIPAVNANLQSSDPVYIYFEIYELQLNKKNLARYTVDIKITDKQSFSNLSELIKMINPFDNSAAAAASSSIERNSFKKETFEYIGLDISVLEKGQYKLKITVTDQISGQIVNSNIEFNIIN